jgi:hypothetical protein
MKIIIGNKKSLLIGSLAALVVFFLLPRAAGGQTETLGAIKYTPQNGWSKSAKEHAVIIGDVNTNG